MPRTIVVRPVEPADYAAAGAATARAYEEYAPPGSEEWSVYLKRIADIETRSRRTVVLVAVDEGVVAGSVTLEVDQRIRDDPERPLPADEAHIRMLGVDPKHRGRGLARGMVVECIAVARARGKRRLTLDTGPMMRAAHGLYESMGFERTASRRMDDGLLLRSYEYRMSAAPDHDASNRAVLGTTDDVDSRQTTERRR